MLTKLIVIGTGRPVHRNKNIKVLEVARRLSGDVASCGIVVNDLASRPEISIKNNGVKFQVEADKIHTGHVQ